MKTIVGVLLAAGRSSRFGDRKLLHPLPDGTPIGLASARHLAQSVDRAIAVVPPADPALARLLEQAGLEAVTCARCSEGMGASLACGVAASVGADGWIIALADMPFIAPATIAAVADGLREGAAVAVPIYHGRRGHPVGFSQQYRAELMALTGDAGARYILERDSLRIAQVAVNDRGILRDIDRPGDLATQENLES